MSTGVSSNSLAPAKIADLPAPSPMVSSSSSDARSQHDRLKAHDQRKKKREKEKKEVVDLVSRVQKELIQASLTRPPKSLQSRDIEDRKVPPTPKPFPIELLDKDDFITLYGVRREGKSWAARYFLHALRPYFRCGEVFTNTKMNGFWQEHFPKVSSLFIFFLFFFVSPH